MARYFNVNTGVMDGDLSVWVEIEECNSGGTGSASLGVNRFSNKDIRYVPANGDHAAHVKLAGSGIELTTTTCVNVNGSPHGRATAYLLYTHIADAIKNTVA